MNATPEVLGRDDLLVIHDDFILNSSGFEATYGILEQGEGFQAAVLLPTDPYESGITLNTEFDEGDALRYAAFMRLASGIHHKLSVTNSGIYEVLGFEAPNGLSEELGKLPTALLAPTHLYLEDVLARLHEDPEHPEQKPPFTIRGYLNYPGGPSKDKRSIQGLADEEVIFSPSIDIDDYRRDLMTILGKFSIDPETFKWLSESAARLGHSNLDTDANGNLTQPNARQLKGTIDYAAYNLTIVAENEGTSWYKVEDVARNLSELFATRRQVTSTDAIATRLKQHQDWLKTKVAELSSE